MLGLIRVNTHTYTPTIKASESTSNWKHHFSKPFNNPHLYTNWVIPKLNRTLVVGKSLCKLTSRNTEETGMNLFTQKQQTEPMLLYMGGIDSTINIYCNFCFSKTQKTGGIDIEKNITSDFKKLSYHMATDDGHLSLWPYFSISLNAAVRGQAVFCGSAESGLLTVAAFGFNEDGRQTGSQSGPGRRPTVRIYKLGKILGTEPEVKD